MPTGSVLVPGGQATRSDEPPSAEYQVDAQPLRPCELQRVRAFRERADHVPQCAEDGSFQ